MGIQDAMNARRRDAHLFGDLANRAAFLAERQDLRMAEHEPRPAADAALLPRFRQTGVNPLGDEDALLFRDRGQVLALKTSNQKRYLYRPISVVQIKEQTLR